MNVRWACLAIGFSAVLGGAHATDGLVPPAVEALWPQWQARITVLAASGPSFSGSPLFDNGAAARGLQGGAMLGDYYFATSSFGAFRASGGLMAGSLGGMPLVNASAGPRLGLTLMGGSAAMGPTSADVPATVPYLGLGFSGALGSSALSITADFGLVAERTSAGADLGRALFGNQGMDRSLRDVRLAPVMQLGMRYTF